MRDVGGAARITWPGLNANGSINWPEKWYFSRSSRNRGAQGGGCVGFSWEWLMWSVRLIDGSGSKS